MGNDMAQDTSDAGDREDRNTRPDMNVGQLLKAFRVRQGWTQLEASAATAVPYNTWIRIERGGATRHEGLLRLLLELVLAGDQSPRRGQAET